MAELKYSSLIGLVPCASLKPIVAKRRDSLYEPGKRTGAWIKYRVNRGQEFIIGAYIPGPHGFWTR